MKITDESKYVEHDLDIIQLIEDLKAKYRTIYWTHIDGDLYVYKPVGRRDHKEICQDESLDEFDKEDEIIRRCLLYPDPKTFDIENLVAGVASQLIKKIMDNSFLSDLETRIALTNYYRDDMNDMQNQITCLINEAFPQFDIEEIENWDIERTAKYLSRAEWKLKNLRGLEFNDNYIQQQQQEVLNEDTQQQPQEEVHEDEQKAPDQPAPVKKERLTPERLAELQKIAPEINWAHDSIAEGGIDAMKEKIDTLSPALRVRQ